MSVKSWEEMLHESSHHGYQEKLIVDLLTLLKQKKTRCSCDGFCGASEQEAGEHVTCRLGDGNLERIRRLFSNL